MMSASVPSADSSRSRYSPDAAGAKSPSNSALIACRGANVSVGSEWQAGAAGAQQTASVSGLFPNQRANSSDEGAPESTPANQARSTRETRFLVRPDM